MTSPAGLILAVVLWTIIMVAGIGLFVLLVFRGVTWIEKQSDRRIEIRAPGFFRLKRNLLFRALLKNSFAAGICLFFAVLMLHAYRTADYMTVRGVTLYGDEAKRTGLLTGAALLSGFIYYGICVIRTLANATRRKEYSKELSEREYWICSSCCNTFLPIEGQRNCPKCNSQKVEQLSGYFERHPESKTQRCPSE